MDSKQKKQQISKDFREKLLVALGTISLVFFFQHLWSSFNIHYDAQQPISLRHDPPDLTFYDDPNFNYSIGYRIQNWDSKREEWFKYHSSFRIGSSDKVFMLTGSQSFPCQSSVGDFYLLRLFRNKVDYCRIHGYDIFYNTAFLNPNLNDQWVKPSIIRATMLAHPESEWIWWVDIDAVITDIELRLPLHKYKNYNFVVNGWPERIYEKRSWLGVNSGVMLFRNCQWSLDFLEMWATMGPSSNKEWGRIFKSTLSDWNNDNSNDQAALAYMLLKQKDKWADKLYLEDDYCFQCYWAMTVERFDKVMNNYLNVEKNVSTLRRRHAEVVTESYGEIKEKCLIEAGFQTKYERRPFITHFTGCSPCSGLHNPMYSEDSCRNGMDRALNFADNQVLRNFGFVHPSLEHTMTVIPIPFDAPSM